MKQALTAISRDPWCITPSALRTIVEIANRETDLEAVETKLGRQLDNTRTVTTRGNVAVIPITGAIVRYGNVFTSISGGVALSILATDFARAVEDDSIDTIVLNIDSPGGQASGIAEFADIVRACNKKTIAYVGNQAASAGYWLASACDEIVANRSAMLGSIGVVYALTDTSEADKKSGITRIDIVSHVSPKKRPDISSKEGQSQIQSWADKLGNLFIEAVANFRGVSTDTVLSDFGQGDMLIAEDALTAGMIDRLGDFESLIEEIQHSNNTYIGETYMTLEALQKDHPSLYADIVSSARAEGAEAERNRIQAIDSISASGFENIVNAMKFDGKSNVNDVKSALFDANEKSMGALSENISSDAKELATIVGEISTSSVEVEAKEGVAADAMALAIEQINKKRGH